jgi:hypothetical protein
LRGGIGLDPMAAVPAPHEHQTNAHRCRNGQAIANTSTTRLGRAWIPARPGRFGEALNRVWSEWMSIHPWDAGRNEGLPNVS